MSDKCCTACGIWKPFEYFHKDSSRRDGHMDRCKECRAILRRVSYERNKPKIIAQHRVYRQKIRDAMTPSETREYNWVRKIKRQYLQQKRADNANQQNAADHP